MERIATSSHEDYEGEASARNVKKTVEAVCRNHDARKMAAIWNEDDLPARAKLLIALGFHMHDNSWQNEGRIVLDTVQKQLLAPLDLGWRVRTEKELALMADLIPILKRRAGGRDISGLRERTGRLAPCRYEVLPVSSRIDRNRKRYGASRPMIDRD